MPAIPVVEAVRGIPVVVPARNLQIAFRNTEIANRLLRLNRTARIRAGAAIGGGAGFVDAGIGARVDVSG